MTRRRAIVILVLVIGALVGMSLSTIVAGEAEAPALYAQMALGNRTLDVWRDTKTHDLTFHWDDANVTVATRLILRRHIVAELSGGTAIDVTYFPTTAAAWGKIDQLYGVTWPRVRKALVGGSPGPAAPTAGVTVPSR